MRLFIALLPGEEFRRALVSLQAELRRRGLSGSYAAPENLHLTLAFLGELPGPEPVLELMDHLRARPVELRLDRIGAFEDTWWAGVREDPALLALARQLRYRLAEAGLPFDRKSFLPHITLARRASWLGPPSLPAPEAVMLADRVSLMRSTPGKQGMLYTELASVLLTGKEGDCALSPNML